MRYTVLSLICSSLLFSQQVTSFQSVLPTGARRTIGATNDSMQRIYSPQLSSTVVPILEKDISEEASALPEIGKDGIYHLTTPEQHKAFLEAHPDKIVVLKFFAPWCKACKGLEPKFRLVVNDKKYKDFPVVWADFSVANNKDYVRQLGVLALPTVHFYAGKESGLVENFPCGPSKVPILKRKLAQLFAEYVDPETSKLKNVQASAEESSPSKEISVVGDRASTSQKFVNSTIGDVGGVVVSQQTWRNLREDIPFFRDFNEEEFTSLMSKARLQTFEEGSVIMREGKPGFTFYVIEEGQVEISCLTAFQDPLTTPSTYLGTVINTFGPGDFFGERALITGEPRAASIRAIGRTKCFAFDRADIPASSVLSGQGQPTTQRMNQIDGKYGVEIQTLDVVEMKNQLEQMKLGSQIRGSVNRPRKIPGVDDDESSEEANGATATGALPRVLENDMFPLLNRLRLLRHVARCFKYIMKQSMTLGDAGAIRRRNLLVTKLTNAQREEFEAAFRIVDQSGDNLISLLELKRAMATVGSSNQYTDEEIRTTIQRSHASLDGEEVLTLEDFLGIMAEAEFYYLFRDTFKSLDRDNTGFVRASDLDEILCGMRDLISDDRKSIIDVDDKDMMIDYEQFSRMLLGSSL